MAYIDLGMSASVSSENLLSKLVAYRTYARRLPSLNRKETLDETITRVMNMHIDRFPSLTDRIVKAFSHVYDGRIMPSMRAMQYAGSPILKNNCRQYNCSFMPIDDISAFSESLFLLLSGCGVGFSVQNRHIKNLPVVGKPRQSGKFLIQDSILGWAQAVDALMCAYFRNGILPIFDYSSISPKGTMLVTTGAPAPGPSRLKDMLEHVERILQANIGLRLKSTQIHDIMCIISDCVVSGGVRRSALISLFDHNDADMLQAKSGNWYITHPWRARANNSAVLQRATLMHDDFMHVFNKCVESNAGEPGIFIVNDPDMGTNPCGEASLRRNTFCNLTTINQAACTSNADFIQAAVECAFIGTLQATYTDFPYLRPEWRRNTEEDALLGISCTGIADVGDRFGNDTLTVAARQILDTNEYYANLLGINTAARTTMLKPEGSSSCVLKTSSGIHPRKSEYYIRRVQINNGDPLYDYLMDTIPSLISPVKDVYDTSVIMIPEKSPAWAILESDDTAFNLFHRAMKYNKYWIEPGHRRGANKHNVSCTLHVKPDEWQSLGEMMWDNREHFSGMSMLPYDGGVYENAPFEACSEDTYNNMLKYVKDIDLSKVPLNAAAPVQEVEACVGGACEVVSLQ